MKMAYLDDFLQKSKELKIFHYKCGNFNSDLSWKALYDHLNSKYEGFDYMKTSLAKIDSSNCYLLQTWLLCLEIIPFMFPLVK